MLLGVTSARVPYTGVRDACTLDSGQPGVLGGHVDVERGVVLCHPLPDGLDRLPFRVIEGGGITVERPGGVEAGGHALRRVPLGAADVRPVEIDATVSRFEPGLLCRKNVSAQRVTARTSWGSSAGPAGAGAPVLVVHPAVAVDPRGGVGGQHAAQLRGAPAVGAAASSSWLPSRRDRLLAVRGVGQRRLGGAVAAIAGRRGRADSDGERAEGQTGSGQGDDPSSQDSHRRHTTAVEAQLP